MEPQLQLGGIDPVVDQLFANFEKRFGQAERFVGIFSTVLRRPLDFHIATIEIDAEKRVAGFGHFLDHPFEPLPQHKLPGLEHRTQLLGGDHVEEPLPAGAHVRLFGQVVSVGRLDAHRELLPGGQLQVADLQGLI